MTCMCRCRVFLLGRMLMRGTEVKGYKRLWEVTTWIFLSGSLLHRFLLVLLQIPMTSIVHRESGSTEQEYSVYVGWGVGARGGVQESNTESGLLRVDFVCGWNVNGSAKIRVFHTTTANVSIYYSASSSTCLCVYLFTSLMAPQLLLAVCRRVLINELFNLYKHDLSNMPHVSHDTGACFRCLSVHAAPNFTFQPAGIAVGLPWSLCLLDLHLTFKHSHLCAAGLTLCLSYKIRLLEKHL